MTIRKIITYPHPILKQKAEKITVFDEELKQLAIDMGATMYNAPGVGLAANQIAIPRQMVVVDISEIKDEKKFTVLVNPVISDGKGSIVDEEGCLSVLEYEAKVKRFQKIHITAQDLEGKPVEFDTEDRFARIIQHETDHLNGVLFIDRLSALKRNFYKKRLKKILKNRQ